MTEEIKTFNPESTEKIPLPEMTNEEKAFISEMAALNQKGVIIRKGAVSVRMFSMGGGKTIVAYLLQETDDGFIVALPTCLVSNTETGVVTAEFIAPSAMVKLFKTGSYLMALPTPTIFYHYLNLTKDRFSSIPGFFNQERRNQVDALLTQLKNTNEIKGTSGEKIDTSTEENQLNDFDDEDSSLFFVKSVKSKYRH